MLIDAISVYQQRAQAHKERDTTMKNYRNTCATKVDRIAARAARRFRGLHFWADYNDLEHCMAIFWRKEV
jgi:hypothetical protein